MTGVTQNFGEFAMGTVPTNDFIKVADYASATRTFERPARGVRPSTGLRIGYPVFLPDDSALLFENGVRAGSDVAVDTTRNGAWSEPLVGG